MSAGVITVTDRRELLGTLHACGRDAWPGIELDFATFSTLAASRIGDAALDELRAAELYLAIACSVGIDHAIIAFDEHYLSRLPALLTRAGWDAATATEIVQATRVRFLVGDTGCAPKIAEYDGRGSLATWLRVLALRGAMAAARTRRREVAVDDLVLVTESSPELDLLRSRFGAELELAFRGTFEALGPRDRNLLRYHVIERLGIDRIAALHGIHRATAARWIARARDALIEGVRRALQTHLQVDAAELDSLFQRVRSKLELSLQWFLTPTAMRR